MKRFLNFFYTISFKLLLFILVILFSWLAGSQLLDALNLYVEDSISVQNVTVQWNDFDYESSKYLEHEIESTIENVITYCLKYHNEDEAAQTDGEMLDYYRRLSDEGYRETAEYLDSLSGVSFAVVNHDSNKIISNIVAINGKNSGTPIRSFFGHIDKTTLIVRNAKNPSFEAGTMSDYAEFVSECAMNYPVDFDLYISFGSDFVFRHDISYYENLHNEMKIRIYSVLGYALLYIFITVSLMSAIVILAGKSEKDSKIIPAALDKMPNDLHLILDVIIYFSLTALFENSIYMLLRSSFADGDYWLGISPGFYAVRANCCIVIITCVILATACTIKRQYKMGTLLTNTYIYRFMKSFKAAETQQ